MADKRIINPTGRSFDRYTYAPAVLKGGLLFISGLNAIDDGGALHGEGDMAEQARVIYRKMGEILAAAGGTFADVVKTTDYITDRTGYRETAAVRQEFLGPDFPAATGVVVKELLGKGVLIEIDAIAVIDGDGA
jgi:enamine deaminase RidA (YjgF/YER057c/UK114 family)